MGNDLHDLFDLPFEDEPSPVAPAAEPTLPHARASAPSAASAGPSAPAAVSPAGASPAAPAPAPVAARRTLTVTELTVQIRDRLEADFYEVWVEGELSNCRPWNGHLYFTLKDRAAQLRGFMFRSSLRYLRFKPADGLRVVVRGKITVYEAKGDYQIVAEHIEPQGLGALQLAFEQLKKRLQQEGLFDAARKRPLPALPRRIGLVTSLDGAAIRDIITVLHRRHAGVHLVVKPARVQGDGAALDVARGVRAVSRVPGVDVVIVARGGGSLEDLWAFNEEVVARAIAGSAVPVIAAVGHESDVTIADFVADVRAATPSAAAEIVIAAKDEFCNRINRLRDRLRAAARGRVQALSRRAHMLTGRPGLAGFRARVALRERGSAELSHALALAMRGRLGAKARRLQQLSRQLDQVDIGRRLAGIRTRLVAADGRMVRSVAGARHRADHRFHHAVARLHALSPLAVLGRGYAVCWNAERTALVRDARTAQAGDRVHVTLARGELHCDVRGVDAGERDEGGARGELAERGEPDVGKSIPPRAGRE